MTAHPDCDVVVVGAGHNALVCAAYLAKAGLRVTVLERRAVVGGAVVTEEIVPGYRFDLGGSAHILIHHTPIVADLELERYGLDYIDLDPMFWMPFPDGRHITVWRDIDRTCQSIAAVSPADADRYRAFLDRWRPLAEATVASFLAPPTAANLWRSFGRAQGGGRSRRAEDMTDLLRPYGDLLRRSFDSPEVQALVGWMAAQSGPPPTEPLSAPFALWHPMYHVSGVRRPRGGSGQLTQALARMIAAHGGRIVVDAPVTRLVVERGRVVGAETAGGGVVTGRAVVSGAHVHTTAALVGEVNLPSAARRLLASTRTGNGFGMVLRCAVDALPDYLAQPTAPDGAPGAHHRALQLLCPSLDHIDRAYADYLGGAPSRDPGLIAMTFSAVDDTLAPPGKHVLFLWGQYYPYALAGGRHWDDIGDRVADDMLAALGRYAPNVAGSVTARLVETPLYLERTLGLLRGNVMHLEMSIDQMFLLRPALTMAGYRGPLPGLYLTGASTHPGGGILGASGRSAAAVVAGDLDAQRWWAR